jgi:hypothetical protein
MLEAIKRWPGIGVALGTNPAFITHQIRNTGIRWQLVRIAQRDEVLDGRAACMHGLHQRQEAQLKTQHLVFGMVGNPGDLVRVHARVDGVQNPARAAHAVIQLKVAVAVPGQRGHAVTEGQAQRVQRVGHSPSALPSLFVGVAVDVAFHPARDDFGVAMVAFSKHDQV